IAGEVSSSLLQKESKVCCKSVGSFNSGDPKKNIERALEKTIEKEVEINNIATEDEIICNRPTVNYESIARSVLRDCGYTGVNGIDPDLCTVIVNVNQQSDDINRAVLQGGAGDQGMMFGYATNETEERMPLGLMLAHRLVMEVGNRRNIKNNSDKIENNGELIKNKGDKIENNGDVINYKGDKVENISIEDKTIGTDDLSISLGPDCKSQVSIEYLNNSGEMIPLRVDAIVMSVQHDKDVSVEQVREELKKVVSKVVPKKLLDNTKLYLQPT
ncbi:S-adenosylmethionine synthase, partial [Dictyocoela roeselum]